MTLKNKLTLNYKNKVLHDVFIQIHYIIISFNISKFVPSFNIFLHAITSYLYVLHLSPALSYH